ncbi:hypothetical protein ACIGXF_38225 [Streptomyces sp. NPDC053086]|uniref:hypothetical protein n=1 Tax=unclassified Streptomyces TaxID=2593676 RepID=UPI0037CFC36A
MSRRSGAKKVVKRPATTAAADGRFENGLWQWFDVDSDGQVLAYGVGGLDLEVAVKSVPGQALLHRNDRDADPILVLTASAQEPYGLAAACRRRSSLRDGWRLATRWSSR